MSAPAHKRTYGFFFRFWATKMEASNTLAKSHLHEVIFADRHYINKLNQLLAFISHLDKAPRLPTQNFFMLIRPRGFGLSLSNESIEALLVRDELLMDHLDQSVADTIVSKGIGTYPVLHLSFNDIEPNITGFDSFRAMLASKLQSEFWQHHVKVRIDQGRRSDLRMLMVELITELSERSGKSVVILIDNYDMPFYIVRTFDDPKEREQALALYFEMLNAFRQAGNKVKFGLLAGHVKFPLSSDMSLGLPHVIDLSFSDIAAALTGFTIEEIKTCYEEDLARIAPQQGVTTSEYLTALEDCYGGFVFSDRMNKVLNPLSVTRALDNDGELYAYSCDNDYSFLQQCYNTQEPDLDWLIDKDGQDMLLLEDISLTPQGKEFGSLLLQQGIVSVNKVTFAEQEHSLSWRYRFGFPNVEMRRVFNIITGKSRPELRELPINTRVYDAGEEEYAIKEND